jgi:hypothetical protein
MTIKSSIGIPIVVLLMMAIGFAYNSASSRMPPTKTIVAEDTLTIQQQDCLSRAVDMFNDTIIERRKLAATTPFSFEMYRNMWISMTADKICDRRKVYQQEKQNGKP